MIDDHIDATLSLGPNHRRERPHHRRLLGEQPNTAWPDLSSSEFLLKMRVRVIREAPAVLILIARLEPLEGQ